MASSSQKPWYLTPSKRWTHFRMVPMRQLRSLLIAVFCLFSILGFYSDLMSDGTVPYATALAIAAISGLCAVIWIIVIARAPILVIWIWVACQFSIGFVDWGVATWMNKTFHLRDTPMRTGVHFASMMILLAVIISYIFFIAYIRTQGKESFRLRNELELAHGIQKTLVPPIALATARYEVYGLSQPSEKVGGDLVDALSLPGGDAVAYLADIAGHGLQAGILMGMLKTAVRTSLLDANEHKPEETLPVLLRQINTVLPAVKEPQMYATFTGMRLGIDGTVHYALAASPPLLHWQAGPQPSLSHVEESQFPLGLLPVDSFDGSHIQTQKGDLLVVATDGILEVCNGEGEEFGIDRLKNIIAQHPQAPLPELAQTILEDARGFGKQVDDQTILLVRCL
ncbi:PP2C family protein-serine/threonine phosphatase [Silvibacterium acidisoli]|uniref:PP2C family protein-serine/threonine phosphatase n=1 Tax=Acidobacteriaceae bacterium ZG23-2 TaxID=2883246 RepID=UPI00406D0EA7